jgi:hypothetical protein
MSYIECSYYKPIPNSPGYCNLNEALCDAEISGEECSELEDEDG